MIPIAPGTTGASSLPGPVELPPPPNTDAPPPRADVLTRPVLVKGVDPVYPAPMRALQVAGDVVVQAVIAVDGTVTAATVLRSVHPLLDEAARRAVLQYRYKPGTRNGVPEPSNVETTVSFRFK